MPDQQIVNAQGVWGYAPTTNPTVKFFINGSGAGRKPGDVVTMRGDATGTVVNIANALNDVTAVGVVAAVVPSDSMNSQPTTLSFGAGGDMPVIVYGPARVNIGAATVAVGDLLTTAATAGTAVTNAGAPAANAVTGSIIAVALEASGAKDANNTIRAYINKM